MKQHKKLLSPQNTPVLQGEISLTKAKILFYTNVLNLQICRNLQKISVI